MKAIETYAFGHRFRSRLEARWATFFEALGIEYEYEHEGFRFEDGTQYLPDFYLPEQKAWFEVKGGEISDKDAHKVTQLAFESAPDRQEVYVFGDIPRVEFSVALAEEGKYPYQFITKPLGQHYMAWPNGNEEEMAIFDCMWHICPWCHKKRPASLDMGLPCQCHGTVYAQIPEATDNGDRDAWFWWGSQVTQLMRQTTNHPYLMKAYLAATQARFEHGETPR